MLHEKWKHVALHFFQIFDFDYKIKYFLLNVTDSTPFLDRNIPEFYRNAILHFQSFVKACKNTEMKKDDILNEIIWHNYKIKFNGKPLNWKHWGKSGFLKLKDIMTNRGELDLVNINTRLLNKKKIYIFVLSKNHPKGYSFGMDK